MLFTDAPLFVMLAVSISTAACSKPPATKPEVVPVPAADAESLEILRESAREVLDRNCGECHTSALPTALRGALAVYDLSQLDWARRMSAAQLRDAEGRLQGPVTPTLGEAEARATRISADELNRFHRYVELETGRRATAQ
jgi:mono/diheme cytochrome c family protein